MEREKERNRGWGRRRGVSKLKLRNGEREKRRGSAEDCEPCRKRDRKRKVELVRETADYREGLGREKEGGGGGKNRKKIKTVLLERR